MWSGVSWETESVGLSAAFEAFLILGIRAVD